MVAPNRGSGRQPLLRIYSAVYHKFIGGNGNIVASNSPTPGICVRAFYITSLERIKS